MKKSYFFAALFTVCSLVCLPSMLLAQGNGNGVKHAPFDGGLSLLVAAGVGAGIKKAYDKRKKADAERE